MSRNAAKRFVTSSAIGRLRWLLDEPALYKKAKDSFRVTQIALKQIECILVGGNVIHKRHVEHGEATDLLQAVRWCLLGQGIGYNRLQCQAQFDRRYASCLHTRTTPPFHRSAIQHQREIFSTDCCDFDNPSAELVPSIG